MARRTAVTLIGSKVAFNTRTGSCMIAGFRAAGRMAPAGRFSPRTPGNGFGRGGFPLWRNNFISQDPRIVLPPRSLEAEAKLWQPSDLPPGQLRPLLRPGSRRQ